MSCASSPGFASHFAAVARDLGRKSMAPALQQPLPAPRSTSYMLMLNSFASDLESILSDLSVSSLPAEPGLEIGPAPSPLSCSSHSSCPNLSCSLIVQPCDSPDSESTDQRISVLERIIRSHPIWYLPDVLRTEAAQLLQNQERGVFIIRKSSQPGTLALSVKLTHSESPAALAQSVQHYLIEAADSNTSSNVGVRLDSSDFIFENLPSLLTHYCQCCDELPVQLQLPKKIRDCSSRQELTSLALLKEKFWSTRDTVVTDSTRKAPPIPPLRLSTFDPFVNLKHDADKTSPRLVAKGAEPTPPPPPPRSFKPITHLQTEQRGATEELTTEQETSVPATIVSEQKEEEATLNLAAPEVLSELSSESNGEQQQLQKTICVSKPRKRVVRRKKQRPLSFSPDESGNYPAHCHSSLADKASDYEDIWGTSPTDEAPPTIAQEEIHEPEPGNSSSNSTLEKLTSFVVVNPDPSEHINSDPVTTEENQVLMLNVEELAADNKTDSITDEMMNCTELNDKENVPEGNVIFRDKSGNCESKNLFKRTSPLYSEPADALPGPPSWLKNKTRPLPLPPFPPSPTTDFTTFAKDGYVRCSVTAAAVWSETAAKSKMVSQQLMKTNKGKQVPAPKPPIPTSGPSLVSRKPFPPLIYLPSVSDGHLVTLQEILFTVYPSAAMPTSPPPPLSPQNRISAYDNLLKPVDDIEDDMSDDGTVTEFSEPWDSSRWDRLLASPSSESRRKNRKGLILTQSSSTQQQLNTLNTVISSDGGIGTLSDFGTLNSSPPSPQLAAEVDQQSIRLMRTRSFKDKMDPLIASPRLLALRSACNSAAGKSLQAFMMQLGRDTNTTFGKSLQNFLQCTKEAKEQRSGPILRNVRQFLSGIKNFLVQHGEPSFDVALLEIRSKLKSNEFLNVDVVLENILHQLVTLPLRTHLYKLLSQEAVAAGSIQQLSGGIKVAREIPPTSLGLKEGQSPPNSNVLQRATDSMERLQRAASPLDKLEHLLDACAVVYGYATETCGETVAAEDFLPLLAWVIARCGFVAAEMEAEFMFELLQPSILAGEGGYFLTALSSAAQLLKNLHSQPAPRPASPSDCSSWMGTLTSLPDNSSGIHIGPTQPQPCVLKVLVADENQSSLLARTIPLRPAMTVRDVTKLLALKLRLSNLQEFTLVALLDGQEIVLTETDNPQTFLANATSRGRHCTFAFRRQDAKIAWPQQMDC